MFSGYQGWEHNAIADLVDLECESINGRGNPAVAAPEGIWGRHSCSAPMQNF